MVVSIFANSSVREFDVIVDWVVPVQYLVALYGQQVRSFPLQEVGHLGHQ